MPTTKVQPTNAEFLNKLVELVNSISPGADNKEDFLKLQKASSLVNKMRRQLSNGSQLCYDCKGAKVDYECREGREDTYYHRRTFVVHPEDKRCGYCKYLRQKKKDYDDNYVDW